MSVSPHFALRNFERKGETSTTTPSGFLPSAAFCTHRVLSRKQCIARPRAACEIFESIVFQQRQTSTNVSIYPSLRFRCPSLPRFREEHLQLYSASLSSIGSRACGSL